MKAKRYEVRYVDFRGWYVWDDFLVKIESTGTQDACRDRAYKLNDEFHSEFEIVETRKGSEIRRLQAK